MLLPAFIRHPHGLIAALAACAWVGPGWLTPALRADEVASPSSTRAAMENIIDRLPELLDLGVPGFAPEGALRLYTHPHFGDLLHEDYFRIPVGARYKFSNLVEFNTELSGYFTHGLGDSVGNGLYELRLGVKREASLSADSGWGIGLDFKTPLSRPPADITDGVRHYLPYISGTRMLMRRWRLIGFGTFGADLIAHTRLTPSFTENELHSDSLIVTLGIAREWPRVRVILTTSIADTTLLSGESQQVYAVRPSLVFPVLRRPDTSARATVTFGGRAVWGPDGADYGVTTTVRIDLKYLDRESKPVSPTP
jgi:hypothetical protein